MMEIICRGTAVGLKIKWEAASFLVVKLFDCCQTK
jgi:hypothetical protein